MQKAMVIFLLVMAGILLINTTLKADNIIPGDEGNRPQFNHLNLEVRERVTDNSGGDQVPMVYLRELARELDYSLYFDRDEGLLRMASNGRSVEFRPGQQEFAGRKLVAAPVITRGRTLIPLEMINPLLLELEHEREFQLVTGLQTDQDQYPSGGELEAVIRIYNLTQESLTLNFNSGQLYDLFLFKEGEEVWRWSEGRMFTMAIVNRELAPGEKLEYRETIQLNPDWQGEYQLRGVITANNELELKRKEIEIE